MKTKLIENGITFVLVQNGEIKFIDRAGRYRVCAEANVDLANGMYFIGDLEEKEQWQDEDREWHTITDDVPLVYREIAPTRTILYRPEPWKKYLKIAEELARESAAKGFNECGVEFDEEVYQLSLKETEKEDGESPIIAVAKDLYKAIRDGYTLDEAVIYLRKEIGKF